MHLKADIGVFGGSGFHSLMDEYQEIEIETPYGFPSDKIAIGTIGNKKVAFLPRHGKNHQYPPHKIPYLANIVAFKMLGVKQIIAPNCVGSLQSNIKPGDFVICDQFIDRTSGRKDTFYDGPDTTHISTADPYCPTLRKIASDICKKQNISYHNSGTCVIVQGPRFSTKAESLWFTKMGWDVVNMTQYPECALAREQEICYVNIALVTDYDAGIVSKESINPVSVDEVVGVLNQNNERVKSIIEEMISFFPDTQDCLCSSALKHAHMG